MHTPGRGLMAIFGAVFAMFAPVRGAMAASPDPVTSDIRIPFRVALAAVTETIQVTGMLHIVTHMVTTNEGVGGDIHINFLDTTGIGLSSGGTYNVGGVFDGGIPPGADIEGLAFIVLMNATAEAQQDLKEIMAAVVSVHVNHLLRLTGASVEPVPCDLCGD